VDRRHLETDDDEIIEEVHASDRVADSKVITQEAVTIKCMVVAMESEFKLFEEFTSCIYDDKEDDARSYI